VELLGDARRREELGRAGRRFVEKRYDWRAIVPRLEQVYEGTECQGPDPKGFENP
jgi:glycosyltransferase involved in cell wall biosynthesis